MVDRFPRTWAGQPPKGIRAALREKGTSVNCGLQNLSAPESEKAHPRVTSIVLLWPGTTLSSSSTGSDREGNLFSSLHLHSLLNLYSTS